MFGFMSLFTQSVFVSGGIFAIATCGLYITLAAGQTSVMTQALVGVGGYAAGVASVELHVSFLVSIAFGLVAGAIVGAVVAWLLRQMNGMVLGVATIAIGQALSLIASNISSLGGSLGYSGVPLQTTINWVAFFLVVVLVGFAWLRRTHLGLALLAVGKEPAVAEAIGISSTFMRVWAFAMGGALTGIAGALQAHWLSVVEPTDLGFANEALIFMYLIVGGTATPWGAVLGAIGINWLLEGLLFTGSARFWILGVLLVVVIILRPRGLLTRRNLPAEGTSFFRWPPRPLRLTARPGAGATTTRSTAGGD